MWAANVAWEGNTDANWNTGANWSGTVIPVNGDALFFGGAGSSGTSLNNDISGLRVISITYSNGGAGFTIGGNPLVIGTSGANTTSFIVSNANNQVFNNDLQFVGRAAASGSDRQVVFGAGAGQLVFNGSLNFSNDWMFPTLSAGTIVLNGTNSGYGIQSVTAGSNIVRVIMRNNVAGTQLILGGDDTLGDKGAGDMTTSNAQYRGVNVNQSMKLQGTKALDLGGYTFNLTGGGRNVDFNGTNAVRVGNYLNQSGNNDLNVTGSGAVSITNQVILSGDQIGRQLYCNITGAGGLAISGHIYDTFHSDGLPGAGTTNRSTLRKAGTGLMTISTANTNAGYTRLDAGTLLLGDPAAIGASILQLYGGTLDVTADTAFANNNEQHWNGAFAYAGHYSLNTGTGAVTITASATYTVSNHTVKVAGPVVSSGAFSLTKSGAGKLELAGANSYTGETRVKQGELLLSGGSLANNSTITVGDTAGQPAAMTVTSGVSVSSAAWWIGTGTGANSNRFTLGGDGSMVTASNSGVYLGTVAGANWNALSVTNASIISGGELQQNAHNAATGNVISLLGNVTWDMNTNTVRGRGVDSVIRVAGGSVLTNVGNIWLGNGNSAAALVIESGGRIFLNGVAAGKDVELARDANCSSNRLEVRGSGSLWDGGNRVVRIGGGAAGATNVNDNLLLVADGAMVTNLNALYVNDWGQGNDNLCLITNGGEVHVNYDLRVGAIAASSTNNGVLVAAGGRLSTGELGTDSTIGYRAGQRDAFVRVTGAGADWNNHGRNLRVGGGAAGAITTNSQLRVSSFGTVSNINTLYVGDMDAHVLNNVIVEDGGTLMVSNDLRVGQNAGANSNYVVIGGAGAVATVQAGWVYVGPNGGDYNSLTVTNNGVLRSTGTVRVGDNAGSTGSLVTVTAGGVWDVGGQQFGARAGYGPQALIDGGVLTNVGHLYWGDGGTIAGSMVVANNGRIYSATGATSSALGYNAQENTLLISSGGLWDGGNKNLSIGGGALTSAFNNVLTVQSGGVLTNVAGIYLGDNTANWSNRLLVSAAGVVDVNGGLTVGQAVGAFGNDLTVNGGSLRVPATLTVNPANTVAFPAGTISAGGAAMLHETAFVVGDGVQSATYLMAAGGSGNHVMQNGMTVAANATLQGAGTVDGDVTVNGSLVPGQSVGTITVLSNLTLGAGATASFELAAVGASDQVGAGTLTLNGQQFADFDFTVLGGFNTGTYVLVNAGALVGSLGATTNGTLGAYQASLGLDVGNNDLVLTVVDANPDSDGDGIEDVWELSHFSSLTNVNATSDWDGDGFPDFSEFVAGTQPTNSTSLLKFNSQVQNGTNVLIRWQSVDGRLYALSSATNVAGAYSVLVSNITGVAPENTITSSVNSSATLSILRLDVQPGP